MRQPEKMRIPSDRVEKSVRAFRCAYVERHHLARLPRVRPIEFAINIDKCDIGRLDKNRAHVRFPGIGTFIKSEGESLKNL